MTSVGNAETLKKLDDLTDLMDGKQTADLLLFIGHRIGAKAEEIAGPYPEKKIGIPLPMFYMLDGKPSKFKSRKQRAYVAILGAQGKIPSKRTGQLGASLTHTVDLAADGVQVAIGSNRPYAPYVIGDSDVQNHYLASLDWKSLSRQIEDRIDEIDQVAEDAIDNYAKGFLGQ